MRAKVFLALIVALVIAGSCKRELKYNSGEYYDSKTDQIANFERDLSTARERQVPERAPKEFAKAVAEFTKAKELARLAEDEEELEEFRLKMHAARMELDRANEVSKAAQ